MTIVNLTGYSYSGKGAVASVLREVESAKSFQHGREFELFRMPGGIIDLRYALVEAWSPMRADMAIRSFQKLTKTLLKRRPRIYNLNSMLSPTGQEYEAEILGFKDELNCFLNKIITFQTTKKWPYPAYQDHPSRALSRRFAKVMRLSQSELVSSCLGGADVFDNAFDFLMKRMVSLTNKKILILNNAFDPSLVSSQKKKFPRIKHIIVDRDPRFIYLDQINKGALNRKDEKTVNEFIKDFKFAREQSNFLSGNNTHKIKFENFILDYDLEVERLSNFLGLKIEDLQRKKVHFNPDKEQFNIHSIISSSNLKKDILQIEFKLKGFLQNFD